MTDVGCFPLAIGDQDSPGDREVAEIAGRQHGVVAFWQLAGIGMGRGAIDHRVRCGRLHRVHKGVYAAGHSNLSREGRWMAAVLACGPGALLSHRSAARLWSILRISPYLTDVTTFRPRVGHDGVALHRSRRIHAEDRSVKDGIPVTSIARTLLDLAEVVPKRVLARAVEEAERLELFDRRAIDRLIGRSRGRRGLRALTAVLREYRPPPFTRSEAERRFIELCAQAGLPRPAANLWIGEHEVDMSWPDSRLVVELDAHRTHGTRAAFERDRRRDAALQLAGYRVLRVTDRRLHEEPDEVMRTVGALLG